MFVLYAIYFQIRLKKKLQHTCTIKENHTENVHAIMCGEHE